MRNPFSSAPGGSREPASAYHEPTPAGQSQTSSGAAPSATPSAAGQPQARRQDGGETVDLQRRRDQLAARVAELQWDLGGLVYEMAVRDRIRVDVIVQRAAVLQDADAELGEVERILRLEETSTAGACASCGAPPSAGSSYCWQCGQPLLAQVTHQSISAP